MDVEWGGRKTGAEVDGCRVGEGRKTGAEVDGCRRLEQRWMDVEGKRWSRGGWM